MPEEEIDNIIYEEAERMVKRLMARGIPGDAFEIQIKTKKRVPQPEVTITDDLDELFRQISNSLWGEE